MIAFQSALELDPDSVVAHYALAVAYHDKGWFDLAITHYERTLALQPDMAQAHSNLGVLFAKSGRMKAALPHFEAAARLQPDNPSFRANLQRARQEIDSTGVPTPTEEPPALIPSR